MVKTNYPTAAGFIPPKPTLPRLREAAKGCHGCDLYEGATQTVFGEGLKKANVMFVGEQPGDREDVEGSRSSVRPGACSTRRWWRPASTAQRST
jgi:uracil-DNA glycosylase